MNPTLDAVNVHLVTKLLAGVSLGIALGTLLPPEPVAVPVAGTLPGLLVGGAALVAGGLLYVEPWRSAESGCGSDCDC